jgi:hypothetical protein
MALPSLPARPPPRRAAAVGSAAAGGGRGERLLGRHRLGERLAPQPRNVPHAHRLVERGGEHEVFLRVKHRAHDVVVVPGEDADAVARLPVPDPDRLIVRRGDDPRVLGVERDGADVVEVAQQREEAAAEFVVPHLDLVVVA